MPCAEGASPNDRCSSSSSQYGRFLGACGADSWSETAGLTFQTKILGAIEIGRGVLGGQWARTCVFQMRRN